MLYPLIQTSELEHKPDLVAGTQSDPLGNGSVLSLPPSQDPFDFETLVCGLGANEASSNHTLTKIVPHQTR